MKKKNKGQLMAALLAFIMTFSNYGNFKTNKYYVSDNNRLEIDTSDKLKRLGKEYYEFYDKYLVKYSNSSYLVNNLDAYFYKKQASSSDECNYKYNGTPEEMLEHIKNNTDKYLKTKSKKKYINALDLNRTCSKGDIRQKNYRMVVQRVYNIFLEEIIKLMNNNLSGNNNEDLCKMRDLKVLVDLDTDKRTENGIIMGEYNNKSNVITIYLDSFLYKQDKNGKLIKKDINKYYVINVKTYVNFKKTVLHEINHMRQIACNDRNKKSSLLYKNIGLSIMEATAESALYDENGVEHDLKSYKNDKVYSSERNFVNDLLLMTITDNTTTIDDFYDIIFNSDSEEFVNYFNLKSMHDFKSFLNILNQYDAKKLRNNVRNINKEDKYAYYRATSIVGSDCKIDLLRFSLRNLIDYNIESNNELELEEIMLLEQMMLYQACDEANIFRMDKTGNLLKDKSGNLYSTYDENFITQLLELENKFNSYIMKNYNITPRELLVVSNRVENMLKYPKRGDVFDASTASIIKSLSEKFPKFKFISSRMGDRLGTSYRKIKKSYGR